MDFKEIVEMLLKHPKIDVNHQDRAGSTILIHAASKGFVGVVEALLDGGTDPKIEDNQGGRAIQRAIDRDKYAVVLNW
jgi:ankyrin repeat protein